MLLNASLTIHDQKYLHVETQGAIGLPLKCGVQDMCCYSTSTLVAVLHIAAASKTKEACTQRYTCRRSNVRLCELRKEQQQDARSERLSRQHRSAAAAGQRQQRRQLYVTSAATRWSVAGGERTADGHRRLTSQAQKV